MRTYQLHIHLSVDSDIQIGRLGLFHFPAGNYIYTGSAKRNLQARIDRHLRQEKTLRWHIDYLLASPAATITQVNTFDQDECPLNQAVDGVVIVNRFGASDCRSGCGSHLKYLS
jgi:Uri superfamily endonuclease